MRFFTPAVLGLLVLVGIRRMPLTMLVGCAMLIGLADARLINRDRMDPFSRLFRTYPKAAVGMAVALIIAGMLFPIRI